MAFPTLVRSHSAPTVLELGTSFGCSDLGLAEAARAARDRFVTMQPHDRKAAFKAAHHWVKGIADAHEMQND